MDTININKPDASKKTICLLAEGSYPYITGGVSSWIQDIISGLSDYNFIILAISADEDIEVKYNLPQNVIAIENRILTSASEKKKNKIQKDFFDNIKNFHDDMMEQNDFSRLGWITEHMQHNKYHQNEILHHRKSWQMACKFGSLHNPLYPFSDYYWSWLSSHEYIMKILTWPIPKADLYHTISTGYAGLIASI